MGNLIDLFYETLKNNNVTTSYKYHWIYSIVEIIEESYKDSKEIVQDKEIDMVSIAIRMLVNTWNLIGKFGVSFGKQDNIGVIRETLIRIYGIGETIDKKEMIIIFERLREDKNLKKEFHKLLRFVPYRYLTPLYSENFKSMNFNSKDDYLKNDLIVKFAEEDLKYFYRIHGNNIIINKDWVKFFKRYSVMVKSLILIELLEYLERINPETKAMLTKLKIEYS